jgi:alanine racemase
MRPTHLVVHLPQLSRNLQAIRAHVAPARVMAVVKANAYGHGVAGVAPYLEPHADCFGVAIVEEGIALRQMGITKEILVMGAPALEQLDLYLAHDLTLTIPSTRSLVAAQQAAAHAGKTLRAHLKIDTGMERIGVHDYEAETFLEATLKCPNLRIEGIFTHFANSESANLAHARLQVERFEGVLHFYEKHSLPTPVRHAANSGGILQLPEAHYDMVRPGIMLYGVYPGIETERSVKVEPALTWKTSLSHVKTVEPGRPVSYGSLWQSDQPATIATIPCGYADGYFRRMTNQAQVLVNGKLHPQVGRICMDQFMVHLEADTAEAGDEAILLGEGITAEHLAEWAGTNTYEVLTNISARVPRVYVK